MEHYYAIVFKAKEGGYIALFPDIPEAFTQGEDLVECVERAQDVLNMPENGVNFQSLLL